VSEQHANPQRDSLIERCRKLSRMTTANGASEAEALSAMGLLAKLMQEHNIQQSELELRAAAGECVRDEHTIFSNHGDAKRNSYPDWFEVASAIGRLFHTRVWFSRKDQDLLGLGFGQHCRSIVFFGLPTDVAASIAMAQIIGTSIEWEATTFARRERGNGGKKKLSSFRLGMINRLRQRINEWANMPTDTGHGTSLVLLKDELVGAAFEALNLQFSSRGANMGSGKVHDSAAYGKGVAAGSSIQLRPNAGLYGQQIAGRK